MRDEIEQVIAELERQKAEALQKQKELESSLAFKYWGIECGLEEAISQIKAVLAEHERAN